VANWDDHAVNHHVFDALKYRAPFFDRAVAIQEKIGPDSPAMAVHRGRVDLLERHLERDANVLNRPLLIDDIYPLALGCHEDRDLALHGAPLQGAMLLHMAVEYEELNVARWLIDRGADVNARAMVDEGGFGGQTPLFSCIVSYNAGRRDEWLGRLLLDRGADPNTRASIRKRLPSARDSSRESPLAGNGHCGE
jgi:ankyrin repeat protein